MRIVNQKDFATGGFYAALGALTAAMASRYPLGSASAMGPGYFPLIAGLVLVVIGCFVLAGSLGRGAATARLEPWHLRAMIPVLAAFVLFAVALEPLGLVVALPLLVLVSSFAHPNRSWRSVVLLSAILLPFVWAVFIWFLGLRFPLLPIWLR